jgi:Putative DNA-binding domain
MLWEGKALLEVNEADIRQVINAGLQEHLQLEYKSAIYEDNDRGRRESLLDICMFANAEGGILLIGVPETRDQQGQPTGIPDPAGQLGINLPNPELILNSLDARVIACIEERLPLELAAIDVGNGLRILAIRVGNSTNKPHCVRYQSHVYFPSRRERSRYEMDIREIKELVMKSATRLEQAQQTLRTAFHGITMAADDTPYLIIGIIPVFSRDFQIDVRNEGVLAAMARFDAADPPAIRQPTYTFAGLERRGDRDDVRAQLHRNGLITFSRRLPLIQHDGHGYHSFYPAAIDILLRTFMFRSRAVYQATGAGGPYLLSMMLRTRRPLTAVYGAGPMGMQEEEAGRIEPQDYAFPTMEMTDFSEIDKIIRPLCDQAHQMFGRDASSNFDAQGLWIARRA